MSQFPQDLDAEFQPTGERQISGLAIGSIICSLVCCVPGLPAIGALLGIASAATISSNPQRKGMGLAIAAIVLGVCITAVQAYLGYQAYEFAKRLAEVVEESPRHIFEPVNNRDMNAFRDAFHGPASNAGDDEVREFFDAVHERYGAFRQARQDDTRQQPGMGDRSFAIAYIIEFEQETVELEIEVILTDDTGAFIFKPGSVIIVDPDRDDLKFPPGAAPDARPSPPSPADPDPNAGDGDPAGSS